jgi:hypothetical protein
LTAYLAAWSLSCLVAAAILVARGGTLGLGRAYWRWLLVPWKVATFIAAGLGITLVAPYTRDPTWDHVDAAFMSILAFGTAPWVVATLYRAARRQVGAVHVYVAACVWLFSASWSYDLYLLFRDGYYPVTWFGNLVASSVLYLAAGLFWSLGWTPAGGWMFAFTDDAWPQAPTAGEFRRVLWPALSLMILVGLIVALFATGWRH